VNSPFRAHEIDNDWCTQHVRIIARQTVPKAHCAYQQSDNHAELIWSVWLNDKMVYQQMVTHLHPGSTMSIVTLLICAVPLSQSHAAIRYVYKCWAVTRYYRGTAVLLFHGTSTVEVTVLP